MSLELTRPFWLLADSLPTAWSGRLNGVLDPRHPSRHSIWTPVWDIIQQTVFLKSGQRLSTEAFREVNAVDNSEDRPSRSIENWHNPNLIDRVATFGSELINNKPKVVITFGQFAFEFVRRSMGMPVQKVMHWNRIKLGDEFRKVLEYSSSSDKPVIIPLLHATISRGQFLDAHEEYTGLNDGNYFSYTGAAIADLILNRHSAPEIWLKFEVSSPKMT